MIQGTSADVGKSLIVAGLCRAYTRRGLRVRPFKAQNMSNNAAVTVDCDTPAETEGGLPLDEIRHGEIGRAQALQARACRAPCSVHMNPVLLKPQTDVDAQVVLRGRSLGTWSASAYPTLKPRLLPAALESLARLAGEADLVLIEGAGCGAEQYLQARDITNMALAEAADLPVVLLGDDSRGGVMAAMLGSHALWNPSERARIVGYLVNKFRGDPAIFAPACDEITRRTGWPWLGSIRWLAAAEGLPPEDSLALDRSGPDDAADLLIAVPRLPRIANFDDLAPLAAEPGIRVRWISPGQPLPRAADVILLPGSKATRADLALLREQGWDQDIHCHVRHGGRVIGLCGGFQMLGRVIRDPHGIEGPPGATEGLGLLDLDTEIQATKQLNEVEAIEQRSGRAIRGFEMHMGRTTGAGLDRPWLWLATGAGTRAEGAVSHDGLIMGSYIHGLFNADGFRHHWLAELGRIGQVSDFERRIETLLDCLANQLEVDLDLDRLLGLAR